MFLVQFLKEQAALAAEEITAESVAAFVANVEDIDIGLSDIEPTQQSPTFWLTTSVLSPTATILFGEENVKKFPVSHHRRLNAGMQGAETGNPISFVNGSAYKAAEQRAVKLQVAVGNVMSSSKAGEPAAVNVVTVDDSAKASIDLWRSGKVAMWEGSGTCFSVQWFSICCIDRKSNYITYIVATSVSCF